MSSLTIRSPELKKSIGMVSVLAILALYLFVIGSVPNIAVLHTTSKHWVTSTFFIFIIIIGQTHKILNLATPLGASSAHTEVVRYWSMYWSIAKRSRVFWETSSRSLDPSIRSDRRAAADRQNTLDLFTPRGSRPQPCPIKARIRRPSQPEKREARDYGRWGSSSDGDQTLC